MKNDKELKQSLIACIMRQLNTMTLEELRQVYDTGCTICDGKKSNAEMR